MPELSPITDDILVGVKAITKFLHPAYNPRQVRYARDTGALPIRKKPGLGIYAFKSELLAALYAPSSLPRARNLQEAPRNGEYH